ncbi:MAG: trypsin-like peptidase domain-containing protein [Candidatus Omnitrophica bacterium]|nr:trypsin-like peptidase domain-containing protein [Candidatus Omnitrophota bacterium]
MSMVLFFPACSKQENPLRHTPVVNIVKQMSPGVVNISTERMVLMKAQPQQQPAQPNFVSGYQAVKLPSLGSGVIIDKNGLILTNAHVIQQAASTIYIIFSNGTKIEGKVVGLNQVNDLAVIKIDPPFPLLVIPMATPDDVLIGEPVIALGNPFGLSSSVSTGVISAIHRDLFTPQGQPIFKDLIQTDTAINPGSSGGALLNMDGKLIGINQIVAQQAQGIGFAIPMKTIKPLLEEFETNYSKMARSASASNTGSPQT